MSMDWCTDNLGVLILLLVWRKRAPGKHVVFSDSVVYFVFVFNFIDISQYFYQVFFTIHANIKRYLY